MNIIAAEKIIDLIFNYCVILLIIATGHGTVTCDVGRKHGLFNYCLLLAIS